MDSWRKAFKLARSRADQLAFISRTGGTREIRQRLSLRAYKWTGAIELEFPLRPEEVTDSSRITWEVPAKAPQRGSPLRIGWVMTPPAPGSGGHTTAFRMLSALENSGHECIIHLWERHGSPVDRHAENIREHWPHVAARIADTRRGLHPSDAYIATGWESAHILGKLNSSPARRLYFVQDYEPYFYPRGSEYALASDTYRFGYRTIALGGFVAGTLKSEHKLEVDTIPFGTDLSVYGLTNEGPRNGVVFYAKPGVARRGYDLAMAALRTFHERHPEQEIHLFGDPHVRPPFPARVHGILKPSVLAELYNSALAGLAISFTNISLVPYEMLACGTIPVMNDDPFARHELNDTSILWAAPTPSALATALSAAVDHRGCADRSIGAAIRKSSLDWSIATRRFVDIVESEVYRNQLDDSQEAASTISKETRPK